MFTGVEAGGFDYITSRPIPGSVADENTLVVYRLPAGDSTLEAEATAAAKPFYVVFRDSILTESQESALSDRLSTDRAYWQQQGIDFVGTPLPDGTISILTADPDKSLPLIESHYGYDGSVFTGRKKAADPADPANPAPPGRADPARPVLPFGSAG